MRARVIIGLVLLPLCIGCDQLSRQDALADLRCSTVGQKVVLGRLDPSPAKLVSLASLRQSLVGSVEASADRAGRKLYVTSSGGDGASPSTLIAEEGLAGGWRVRAVRSLPGGIPLESAPRVMTGTDGNSLGVLLSDRCLWREPQIAPVVEGCSGGMDSLLEMSGKGFVGYRSACADGGRRGVVIDLVRKAAPATP